MLWKFLHLNIQRSWRYNWKNNKRQAKKYTTCLCRRNHSTYKRKFSWTAPVIQYDSYCMTHTSVPLTLDLKNNSPKIDSFEAIFNWRKTVGMKSGVFTDIGADGNPLIFVWVIRMTHSKYQSIFVITCTIHTCAENINFIFSLVFLDCTF